MKKNQYPCTRLASPFAFGLFLSFFAVFPALGAPPPSVVINDGAAKTEIRKVTLRLTGPLNAREMKIANNNNFTGADWEPFREQATWYVEYGTGTKTVYVRFKDRAGTVSDVLSDSITLSPPPIFVSVEINGGTTSTDSRYAIVSSTYSRGIESFRVSNESTFAGLSFREAQHRLEWTLSAGSREKTMDLQFRDASGVVTTTTEKRIAYTRPPRYIPEGSALEGQGNSVYYFGFDGKIHPYLNSHVFHSWYPDFKNVVSVSDAKLRTYPIGEAVCVRAGTLLVKFTSLRRVYAVLPGCVLQPIRSETEAYILYGSDWHKRVVAFNPFYAAAFQTKSLSVEDKKKNIFDKDRDGLDAVKEASYRSSDTNDDTDSDRVSDYEEIEYWFSDPNDPDSDGDGFFDGAEIMSKHSPLGEEPI